MVELIKEDLKLSIIILILSIGCVLLTISQFGLMSDKASIKAQYDSLSVTYQSLLNSKVDTIIKDTTIYKTTYKDKIKWFAEPEYIVLNDTTDRTVNDSIANDTIVLKYFATSHGGYVKYLGANYKLKIPERTIEKEVRSVVYKDVFIEDPVSGVYLGTDMIFGDKFYNVITLDYMSKDKYGVTCGYDWVNKAYLAGFKYKLFDF